MAASAAAAAAYASSASALSTGSSAYSFGSICRDVRAFDRLVLVSKPSSARDIDPAVVALAVRVESLSPTEAYVEYGDLCTFLCIPADLKRAADLAAEFRPLAGRVPPAFLVDFLKSCCYNNAVCDGKPRGFGCMSRMDNPKTRRAQIHLCFGVFLLDGSVEQVFLNKRSYNKARAAWSFCGGVRDAKEARGRLPGCASTEITYNLITNLFEDGVCDQPFLRLIENPAYARAHSNIQCGAGPRTTPKTMMQIVNAHSDLKPARRMPMQLGATPVPAHLLIGGAGASSSGLAEHSLIPYLPFLKIPAWTMEMTHTVPPFGTGGVSYSLVLRDWQMRAAAYFQHIPASTGMDASVDPSVNFDILIVERDPAWLAEETGLFEKKEHFVNLINGVDAGSSVAVYKLAARPVAPAYSLVVAWVRGEARSALVGMVRSDAVGWHCSQIRSVPVSPVDRLKSLDTLCDLQLRPMAESAIKQHNLQQTVREELALWTGPFRRRTSNVIGIRHLVSGISSNGKDVLDRVFTAARVEYAGRLAATSPGMLGSCGFGTEGE